MSLIDRVEQLAGGVQILTEWLGAGAITVDRQHAQERANTCRKCPQNQNGNTVTGAVADVIRKQVEIKNHLQLRVFGEKALHTCKVCGCVTRLKIWLPFKNLGLDDQEIKNYPTNCWITKEYKHE